MQIDDKQETKNIIITEDAIRKRVIELGKQITNDYKGKEVICVGVLKGAFIFMADLVREIDMPVKMGFIQVSSYGNEKTSSGVVKLSLDLQLDIKDKHVVIIEDIIDSGLTMKYLIDLLVKRQPKDIAICSFLRKDIEKSKMADIDIKYLGFTVPKDSFVVGYGLDCAEDCRNLRCIVSLKN